MIIITAMNNNIVEGLVSARCAVGYYKVKIKVNGFKIVDSECECGQKFCRHTVQLYLHYIRVRNNDNHNKTIG
ncbi:hypothetical protein GFS33_01735 [Sulfolobus sp. E11-6]|nr:hypothetical protein GFS33_01735 [Sulfolobus sp. E11-6]